MLLSVNNLYRLCWQVQYYILFTKIFSLNYKQEYKIIKIFGQT